VFKLESTRTGTTINQPTGYYCFVPHKIYKKSPEINIDRELLQLIAESERELGQLNGITKLLANPELFVAFYVRKEAVLSAQIEGTQCSLDEVIKIDEKTKQTMPIMEVVNYVAAMDFGLEEIKKLPMSIRLINSIHEKLLKAVRGSERQPGEFKRQQNWIGPAGCSLNEAVFVPPPPDMMIELMGDLENYYHADDGYPLLIKAAILHAHFETIHPYIDGNGRLGRLLTTFMLCEKKILDEPLLYLSLFFKEYRSDYYDLLMDVRFKGDWESWIKFFLRGVRKTSIEARETVCELIDLEQQHKKILAEKYAKYSLTNKFYDLLCEKPIISIPEAQKRLNTTYPTMKKTFDNFLEADILAPYDSKKANRTYSYRKYLEILRRGT